MIAEPWRWINHQVNTKVSWAKILRSLGGATSPRRKVQHVGKKLGV